MKLNTLFIQIFSGFVITIVLFTVVLMLFFEIGLSSAIDHWSEDSFSLLKEVSIEIIEDSSKADILDIPQGEPVFIYDREKNLIHSNRGLGLRNSDEKEFIPLYKDKVLVGYLYTLKTHFMDNHANQKFTDAIKSAIIYALLFSSVLVVILALFITGKISRPAKHIASFLQTLSAGEQGKTIKSRGAYEIKQIADAVNNLSKKLARESEIRTQWARDIAHDLRTPVAALKAQFEAMSHGALEINLKRVNQNLNEVVRMEYLVEDLSELMRLEEPEIKLYPDDIGSEDFLNQIVIRCSSDIADKSIKTDVKVKVTSFIGDEMLLHRAVSNIWSNAIRHTEVNGGVNISIDESEGFTIIRVQNSGDLIPEVELPKIFDRLFRGESARHSQGSGLGLTITSKIVALHGGTINVESSSEDGTTFTIKIPE